MSELEKLIKKLCPDGVEYKKISDVATMSRGIRVIRSQLAVGGHIPVYQNSLTPLGYYDKSNCTENTTFIISAGAAGEIGYSKQPFWAADDCWYFDCPECLNSRFLYHILQSQQQFILSNVRRSSVPRLSRSVIDNMLIPVPPLPVQQEIVRILDNFTELTKELTKELTARKKQYEHYRDMLLSFDDIRAADQADNGGGYNNVIYRKLGEIFNTRNGYTPSTSNPEYWDNGSIPWFVMDDIRKNGRVLSDSSQHITKSAVKKSGLFPANSIIVTTSATIGEHALITADFLCNQRFTCLSVKDEFKGKLNIKFAFYYAFKLDDFCKRNTTKSSFSSVDMNKFYNFEIPVPPLETQKRIVCILDKFEMLANSLSDGLPAEIEARKKQYEYYRDKLLDFKDAGGGIIC